MFLARIIYDNSYEAVRFFLFLLSSCSLFFMAAVLFPLVKEVMVVLGAVALVRSGCPPL